MICSMCILLLQMLIVTVVHTLLLLKVEIHSRSFKFLGMIVDFSLFEGSRISVSTGSLWRFVLMPLSSYKLTKEWNTMHLTGQF